MQREEGLEQHGLIIELSRLAAFFARCRLFNRSSDSDVFCGIFRSRNCDLFREGLRNSDSNFFCGHFRSSDCDLFKGCLMDHFRSRLSHLFSGLWCQDLGLFHHALRLNNNLSRQRDIFHGLWLNDYRVFFTDNERGIRFNYFFNRMNRGCAFLDFGCLRSLYD